MDKISRVFKNMFTVVSTIGIILFVIFLVVSVVTFQFNIYKKKHGQNMTFIEFLFDPEVK
jgi:hypothetical protein